MGQVTIYLNKETEDKLVTSVRAMHVSKSKWVADAIEQKLRDQWPPSVRQLPGSWSDFPSPDEVRHSRDTDVERESL